MTITSSVLNTGTWEVPIADLNPHPHNPNVGDVEAIRESIRVNGFWGAVIARELPDGSFQALAGWHRAQAAAAEGYEEIPVTFVQADDVLAVRILLADNETARRGVYDRDVLAGLLDSLESLDGTGFGLDDLDPDPGEDEDEGGEDEGDDGEFPTQYGIILVFGSEDEQREAYDRISALGYDDVRVAVI